jgi:hypothetical protein
MDATRRVVALQHGQRLELAAGCRSTTSAERASEGRAFEQRVSAPPRLKACRPRPNMK